MARAIERRFKDLEKAGQKAFIPFIMAGDPDLESTIRLVPELERAGSSIVELGIPFSDPVADGPVIQRAGARALSRGYRLAEYLGAIREIRRISSVPIILFSYFNPLLQYGLDKLAQDARLAGVDGVLVTDMIPEESDEYRASLERFELDSIFLAAPTSSRDRIRRIAQCSSGFVYVVSRAGVTGTQEALSETILPTITSVREFTGLPIAVGFGISCPDHVKAVWNIADGAVVGSAIVAQIEKEAGSDDLARRTGDFCRWLTGGVNAQS
jgi:tryptophan synthase alpha chain